MTGLLAAYRRAGAELPFGDPSRPRGIAMEGTFWRFTTVDGRVVVVLRGECLDAEGRPWRLLGLAAHPDRVLRWTVAGDLSATATSLDCAIEGAELRATWSEDAPWPRRAFGALGPAHALPGLGQYWHPHLLHGRASGSLTVDGAATPLDGAVYAERNWGSTFAEHWWWGQASDVGGASVAFAGGRMFGGAPTAVVVAHGGEVLRFAPPLARMTVATDEGRWRIHARGLRHTLALEAEADPTAAFVLPVPHPADRDVVLRSHQHLAGRLALTVRRGGRTLVDGVTETAGLERGYP